MTETMIPQTIQKLYGFENNMIGSDFVLKALAAPIMPCDDFIFRFIINAFYSEISFMLVWLALISAFSSLRFLVSF